MRWPDHHPARWLIALGALLPTAAIAGCAPPGQPGAHLPDPDPNEMGMVFYVQRSLNTNTVIYAARLTAQGGLDPEQPIEAYWRIPDRGNRRSELDWKERQLAYGVQWQPHRQRGYRVNIVSHKQRRGHLYQDASAALRLEGLISGRPAQLRCAYVELEDDRALIPSVRHVDLYGNDLTTGEPLHERIRD